MSNPSRAAAPFVRAPSPLTTCRRPRSFTSRAAAPGDRVRVEPELVAVVEVRVEQRCEQVVCGGDRVQVAGEMEVQVLHRHDLRVPAAGRTALDPEDRSERGLADAEHGVGVDQPEPLDEPDRGRCLALALRGRRDRSHADEACRPAGRRAGRGRRARSSPCSGRTGPARPAGGRARRDLLDRPHRRGLRDLEARHRRRFAFHARRATRVGRMARVAMPQPYDFELSTERFRAFGVDPACLWHEGGLHRVVRGRRCGSSRRRAASRSSRTTRGSGPGRAAARAPVRPRRLPRVGGGRAACSLRSRRRLRGFRPPLQPDPWEALVTSITAQQVSLLAAFAIRSRLIERFGVRRARVAFPTAERIAAARRRRRSSPAASRAARPSTCRARTLPTSTSTRSARCPTTRCTRAVRRIAASASGRPTGSSPATSRRPHAWPAGDLALRKAVRASSTAGR